jgi:hypothetical protein
VVLQHGQVLFWRFVAGLLTVVCLPPSRSKTHPFSRKWRMSFCRFIGRLGNKADCQSDGLDQYGGGVFRPEVGSGKGLTLLDNKPRQAFQ